MLVISLKALGCDYKKAFVDGRRKDEIGQTSIANANCPVLAKAKARLA